MDEGGSVVDWEEAPSHAHSPGPNSAKYEAFRELCGAHLVCNTIWNVKHRDFCVHQMLMRDPIIDSNESGGLGCNCSSHHGNLRKYGECVETALGIAGRAEAKLKQRFELMFLKRTGPDGLK